MSNRIVIVGAGYTGLRLAEAALDRGYDAVGTTRSAETTKELRRLGAERMMWDALEDSAESLEAAIDPASTVVYSVPTLFDEHTSAGEGLAQHVEPVEAVIGAAEAAGASRFIYLSSTSVYGDHDGEWVDETTPTAPTSPMGKMRRDIEEHVLERDTALAMNVARLVGIYGPGRTMADYIERGFYRLVDGGEKPSNRIHVDDIVGGLMALIERGPDEARLYNFSDGHPRSVADVVDWLVERLGLERPESVSMEEYARERSENAVARWRNTYRVDNHRLVDELDYEFEYPDVFAGLESIYADE